MADQDATPEVKSKKSVPVTDKISVSEFVTSVKMPDGKQLPEIAKEPVKRYLSKKVGSTGTMDQYSKEYDLYIKAGAGSRPVK
jgi:hypothetical protein